MVIDSTLIDLLACGRVREARDRLCADYLQMDQEMEKAHRQIFGDDHEKLWNLRFTTTGGARQWRENLINLSGELSLDGREEATKISLTPTRREILRKWLLFSEQPTAADMDLDWFKAAGFVDQNNELTQHGMLKALETPTLEQQCEILNLPLREGSFPTGRGKMETRYARRLRDLGYPTLHDDSSPILWLIYAFVYEDFFERSKKSADGYRFRHHALANVLTRFPDNFSVDTELASQLCQVAKNTSSEDLLRQLKASCSFSRATAIFLPFLSDVVQNTPIEVLREIFVLYTQNPMAYRFGWPDIAFVDCGRLKFSEIKIADKLHINQLRLLPQLNRVTQTVEVVRLRGASA